MILPLLVAIGLLVLAVWYMTGSLRASRSGTTFRNVGIVAAVLFSGKARKNAEQAGFLFGVCFLWLGISFLFFGLADFTRVSPSHDAPTHPLFGYLTIASVALFAAVSALTATVILSGKPRLFLARRAEPQPGPRT